MTTIMNRHSIIAALLCAGAMAACGDPAVNTITEPPSSSSRIRFYHFGPSAPGVNFYANDTKVTAIVSTTGTESTTGTVYSALAAGGTYTVIAPGQVTLTGRIAATIDKDLPIATLATTIDPGKDYSYYISGVYSTATKTADSFLVEDPVVPPTDFSVATVRFVHAISNANPMTLYMMDTTTKVESAVGAQVAYKGAGAFTTIPRGVYDLRTRYAGVVTNAMTRPAVTLLGGKVYTITARGDLTGLSTACAAANRTCLDFSTNR